MYKNKNNNNNKNKDLQPVSISNTGPLMFLRFTAFALTLGHYLLFLFLFLYLRQTGMVNLHCFHTPRALLPAALRHTLALNYTFSHPYG